MSRLASGALAAALVVALVCASGAAAQQLSFVTQWGGSGTGPGQFSLPQGVAVTPGGDVFVADVNNDRVEKFDSNGNFLLQFGSHGSGPGQFNNPGHLALDPQANVIVSDEGGYRVEKFSPSGTFLQQYGGFGQAAGQFSGNTRGVAADAAGNVYVVQNGGGGQIVKFTSDGRYVSSWPAQAPGAQSPVPRSIAFDPSGVLYLTDEGNGVIYKFSDSGQFLGQWGQRGNQPQQLADPRSIAVDAQGHVFVGDRLQGIKEFTTDGTFVALTSSTGQPPPGDSFSVADLGIGPGGDVFVTDPGNAKRVIRFRQGVPPPVLGKTASVTPENGVVLIKLPPGASPRASGLSAAAATGFVPLTAAKSVPVGSTLDTTRGTVKLSTATNSSGGTQDGHFSQGQFKLLQAHKNPLTTLSMTGGNLRSCSKLPRGGAPKASAARRRGRSLFSNVHGHFRTRGRNSTATVRGTAFLVKDTCAGTLTNVKRGTVTVRDLTLGKNVIVKAHHAYLARAPR
jgi:DNA-binding beta-propeller fold protein YncE